MTTEIRKGRILNRTICIEDMSIPETAEPLFTCEERLEACEIENKELREALRKEIHFRTAKDMQGPRVWLPVMNLVEIFHEAYQIRNQALANNNSKLKLMFTVSNEGRIVAVSSAKAEEDGTS